MPPKTCCRHPRFLTGGRAAHYCKTANLLCSSAFALPFLRRTPTYEQMWCRRFEMVRRRIGLPSIIAAVMTVGIPVWLMGFQDAAAATRSGNQTQPGLKVGPTAPPSSVGEAQPAKQREFRSSPGRVLTCTGQCQTRRDACIAHYQEHGGVPGAEQRCQNYYTGCVRSCGLKTQ